MPVMGVAGVGVGVSHRPVLVMVPMGAIGWLVVTMIVMAVGVVV